MEERTTIYDERGNELGYVALHTQSGFWIAVGADRTVLFAQAWTSREAEMELRKAHGGWS